MQRYSFHSYFPSLSDFTPVRKSKMGIDNLGLGLLKQIDNESTETLIYTNI